MINKGTAELLVKFTDHLFTKAKIHVKEDGAYLRRRDMGTEVWSEIWVKSSSGTEMCIITLQQSLLKGVDPVFPDDVLTDVVEVAVVGLSKVCSLSRRRRHHHHHHFLTRSGLTHPELSSMVFLGSFCLLECSFLSIWVICYVAFDLHVVSSLSCSPVFCLKLGLY
jgi:hypothetical protein